MFDKRNESNECIMPIASVTIEKGKKFLSKINSKEMDLVFAQSLRIALLKPF